MTNEVFVENVAEGRSMRLDAARALATGLPFTGEQAVENGLADEVGVFDDAIEAAAQLAGTRFRLQCDYAYPVERFRLADGFAF